MDQCAADKQGPAADSQKTTWFMFPKEDEAWANENVATLVCQHEGKHPRAQKQSDDDTAFVTKGTEVFPPGVCAVLADYAYTEKRQQVEATSNSTQRE